MKHNKRRKKIVIFIPTLNAEKTIISLIDDIYKSTKGMYDILIIDDGSTDATVTKIKRYKKIRKVNLIIIRNKKNKGYGYTQKRAYNLAIKRGYQLIIMIHGDMQHPANKIPMIIEKAKKSDVVLTSRIKNAREGGMPLWRYMGNKALTSIENKIFNKKMSEYHSGYRAFKVKKLQEINFQRNSNSFSFDSQIIAELMYHKAQFEEIDIPAYYGGNTRSISFVNSIFYSVETLYTLLLYTLQKNFSINIKLFSLPSKDKNFMPQKGISKRI